MKRMIRAGLTAAILLAGAPTAHAEIIRQQANQKVPQTVATLVKAVKARGLRMFAVIDHAAGARSVGLKLRPATLVVFGNPKIGAPLTQISPAMGLELPIRVLVWEDKQGRVWIGRSPASFMARRRGVPRDHPIVKRMGKVLDAPKLEAAK